jgi:hypothetical protein
MRKILSIILLLVAVAGYSQSNDPFTKRLNNLGERTYSGTTFGELLYKIDNDSNNYFKHYKPIGLNRLNTTQQNALTLLSPALTIFNTDTATGVISYWDGANWQYVATRAYARSVGGGGGAETDTTVVEYPLFVRTGTQDTIYLRYGFGLTTAAADSALRADTTRGLGNNGLPTYFYVDSLFNASGAPGTVTQFNFTDGSGFDGTVTNATSTPTLALTTTLATGSVFFAGAAGALAEDNTNFFYNTTDDRLGLGTATPASRLSISTASLGVTQATTSGLSLVNPTAAAAGAQQISPELRFRANGWKTNATAASQTVDFRMDVLPVEAAANPTGILRFSTSINGAAFANLWNMQSAGHWVPETNGVNDIGTTALRVRQGYFNGFNINTSVARADNTINVIPGFTVTNGTTPAATGTNNIFTFSSAASAATAGITNFILWGASGFAPTSGTAIFNQHRFAHTINQTGGANGVTRTLFIDPTITAAANYFAIATTQGKVQFNALPTATTIDSVMVYEDGEMRPTLALNMPGAVLSRSSTLAATSGTGETDLHTYTTPANTLNADNEFLEYYVSGIVNPTSVNDGGNITIRIYWAGTEVLEAVSLSGIAWAYTVRVTVMRTSSSNARVTTEVDGGAFPNTSAIAPTSVDVTTTFSNTNIIKVTGQASDADQGMNASVGIIKRWR